MSSIAEPGHVAQPPGIILYNIRYGDYVRLRDEWENRHVPMVYYNGTLEIMHRDSSLEVPSRRIGIFIFVLCCELSIDGHGTGSTTFRRGKKDSRRGYGKEPHESFYFANAHRVLGNDSIRLDRDPPPDLWIELDARAGVRGRLPLYAALGVPEIWRYDVARNTMRFGRLVDGRKYKAIHHSLSLPVLTPAHVLEALALGRGICDTTWGGRLRDWIRENFRRPPN